MHTRTILLAAALLAVVVPTATAQTFTWDGGGGNGNWSVGANWVGDVAPPAGGGAGVIIALDGTLQTTTLQNISAPFVLNQLQMQTNAANGFIVNGNQLQFAGAGAGGEQRPALERFDARVSTADMRCDEPVEYNIRPPGSSSNGRASA